jgi:hypothetical protein
MTRKWWFRLTAVLFLTVCVLVSAEDRNTRPRDTRRKSTDTGQHLVNSKDKGKAGASEQGKDMPQAEAGAEAKEPAASPEDIDAFRKRQDPDAVEIVGLYNEIDKAYTDLRTALNVSKGSDREARKAKGEIRGLETTIKRQTHKLKAAVEKYAGPIEREYKATKAKYDSLQEKARQMEEQKQDKKATALHQQADTYNTELDSSKRLAAAARSFLHFESAEGIEVKDDSAGTRARRPLGSSTN